MHPPSFFNADFIHVMFLIFSFFWVEVWVKSFELNMEVKYIFSIWNKYFTWKERLFLFLTLSSFSFLPPTTVLLVKKPKVWNYHTCSEDEAVCPQDWNHIRNNCFFQSEHEKTWMDSQEACIVYHGSLAIFNSRNQVVRFLLCKTNLI